jgi:hypothetical protein
MHCINVKAVNCCATVSVDFLQFCSFLGDAHFGYCLDFFDLTDLPTIPLIIFQKRHVADADLDCDIVWLPLSSHRSLITIRISRQFYSESS